MAQFFKTESGAVTVDWVVLTAGLVGLGLAVMAVVSTGVQNAAEDVEDKLVGTLITTSFAPDNASIVADYQHEGCAGGYEAAYAYAEAFFCV